MNVNQYKEYILPSLEEAGISFYDADTLNGYGGWFDEDKKELAVWKNGPVYYETLVHEYSHFLQWKNNRKLWDCVQNNYSLFFCWLDGEVELDKQELDDCLYDIIRLERNCEILTITQIKELNLDLNAKVYAQMANAYMWSYHSTRQMKKWPTGSIYQKEIVSHMPTRLQTIKHYCNLDNLCPEIYKKYLTQYS